MKNRFTHLLDSRGLTSEDNTTAALADGLRGSRRLLHTFVEFLFSGSQAMMPNTEGLDVVSQYRFPVEVGRRAEIESRGKIDLALIDRKRSIFIGIEFKVRDGEKPARLHNYRLLMKAEGFKNDYLFAVVQKPLHDFSHVTTINAVHTWNSLRAHLLQCADNHDENDRQWIVEYSEFLVLSSTTTAKEKVSIGQRRSKNASPSELATLLHDIRTEVDGKILGGPRTDKGIPLHLQFELVHWKKKFPGHWHERVWLYAHPASHDICKTGWYCTFDIVFHNANFTALEYAARMLPLWAPITAKAGLVVSRGPARGWDGNKRVILTPPWKLDCSPKYFSAMECKETVISKTQHIGTRDGLIEDAVARIEQYVSLVDTFPT